ncbi:MAG TPA: hypothetical protein VLW83_09220 [Candidatus Acidoferrales bacterium]|nr:hypothetical protein [Candidatus Acidoferrales bacterium]
MRKIVLLAVLATAVIAGYIGLQFASAYIDNIELHDDVRDVAAQNGVNIGLNSPKTDDEVRMEVVRTAAEHGLHLRPDQINLQKYVNADVHRIWYDVTVDYTVRVNLLVCSYTLHFVQSNKGPTPLQPHVRPESD